MGLQRLDAAGRIYKLTQPHSWRKKGSVILYFSPPNKMHMDATWSFADSQSDAEQMVAAQPWHGAVEPAIEQYLLTERGITVEPPATPSQSLYMIMEAVMVHVVKKT